MRRSYLPDNWPSVRRSCQSWPYGEKLPPWPSVRRRCCPAASPHRGPVMQKVFPWNFLIMVIYCTKLWQCRTQSVPENTTTKAIPDRYKRLVKDIRPIIGQPVHCHLKALWRPTTDQTYRATSDRFTEEVNPWLAIDFTLRLGKPTLGFNGSLDNFGSTFLSKEYAEG